MMQERLMSYVLEPQSWVTQANGNVHVARFYQNQLEPVATFSSLSYTANFSGRLLLLAHPEWQILGLGVALSPYMGQIANNMDGHLRKVAKSYLDDDKIAQLDELGALIEDKTTFLLPRSVWKSGDVVRIGISSIKAWGDFTQNQKKVMDFRFPEAEMGVSGLTTQLMEELCKILFPSHPWLVSGQD